jgi:hypothetical protein
MIPRLQWPRQLFAGDPPQQLQPLLKELVLYFRVRDAVAVHLLPHLIEDID